MFLCLNKRIRCNLGILLIDCNSPSLHSYTWSITLPSNNTLSTSALRHDSLCKHCTTFLLKTPPPVFFNAWPKTGITDRIVAYFQYNPTKLNYYSYSQYNPTKWTWAKWYKTENKNSPKMTLYDKLLHNCISEKVQRPSTQKVQRQNFRRHGLTVSFINGIICKFHQRNNRSNFFRKLINLIWYDLFRLDLRSNSL
jgi:hypothetical protein